MTSRLGNNINIDVNPALRLFTTFLLFSFLLFHPASGWTQERSLDQGLDEVARKITESIPSDIKQTVAVMDFNDLQGNVTMLGRFVSEELITILFQTRQFKVIERSLLEKALQELKFNTTDLVDTSNAKQLGKVVGADAIVTGTITDLGQSVKINARVIAVESGEIISAASALITKNSSLDGMLRKTIGGYPVSGNNAFPEKASQEVEARQMGSSSSKPMIYEDDFFRVTVRSFNHTSKTATLEIWYENLSNEVIKLRSLKWGTAYAGGHSGTSLLSQNGNKWKYVQDTQVGNHYGGIELIPKQKLLNIITFSMAENDDSQEFTYTGDYSISSKNRANNRSVTVIIRDINGE